MVSPSVEVLAGNSVLRLGDLEGCGDRYRNSKDLGYTTFPVAVTKYPNKAA